MRRPRLTPLRIALFLGVCLSVVRFNGCAVLQLLDSRSVDMRLIQRGAQSAAPEVVIVAIDDASLEKVGRWPWSRATVARLLDQITAAEPAVIGFDIIQSEEASAPTMRGLRDRVDGVDDATWSRVRLALSSIDEEDQTLADAIRASGRTVLGYFFSFDRDADGSPSRAISGYNVVRNSRSGKGERRVPMASDVVENLETLSSAAIATGYFNTVPDVRDGLYRRLPLVIRYGDDFAVPLSLAMLHAYWPEQPTTVRFADFGVESVQVGPRIIPVAEDGQMLLNYRGPRHTFRHVSAADVLAGDVETEAFAGKLVLVGVTATAVVDIRATPFDGVFPGVEMHATAIDNILRADFLQQPDWIVLVEIAAVMIAATILGLALQVARGTHGASVALLLLAAYLLGSQELFLTTGITLAVVFPVLAIVVIYGAIGLQHFAAEQTEKRRIRDAFGLYLSPELARSVSEKPEILRLGGDKRELTVFFSDIRGFTSISERLAPEALVELLNVYLGEMTDIVFNHDGTLDKYIGDAIMAVWGAPVPQADHASRACATALDMLERLRSLEAEWHERGWPHIDIGIGVHTGEMVVGNMGSDRRLSYTVVGDNVNVGSRLEGLTKVYGAPIIVSEETLRAAAGSVVARELDLVRVKGRAVPVRIFEILGLHDSSERWTLLIERFAAALDAYRARRWDVALDAFEVVLEAYPDDGPARLYAERCRACIASEPAQDWQTVAEMDTK